MRVVGSMMVLTGVTLGTIGALWATFAIIGSEWDYCPSGSDCIAGEFLGLTIMAVAALVGWSGLRLARSR